MASTKYQTLGDDCSDSHDDDLLAEVEAQHKGFLSRKASLVLVCLLTCSISLNAIWIYGSLGMPHEAFRRAPSYYGTIKEINWEMMFAKDFCSWTFKRRAYSD
jgi:hypothetical protein